MEIRKLSVPELTVQQILSLLEITQATAPRRPDWQVLRRELARFQLLGLYDGDTLAGYAQIDPLCPYLSGSIRLVTLRYRCQYNQEPQIIEMIHKIASSCPKAEWMLMDVDARHDFNCPIYRKIGFQRSILPSPLGKNRIVLLCPMDSVLKS